MGATALGSEPLPSLLGTTFRRSTVVGRFQLVYGSGVSALLGAALGFSGGAAFSSSFPLLLPIFGMVGSTGALVVFTNDRQKGVLEYLMSYGVSPRRLFANFLVVSLLLASVVLVVALGVGLGVHVAREGSIAPILALTLGVYSVPMSYASAAFAATVGMFWTSLSSPRQGMNSSLGLIPLVGMLPALGTLGVVILLETQGASAGTILLAIIAAIGVITVAVALLLSLTGRLLRRERLLSPA